MQPYIPIVIAVPTGPIFSLQSVEIVTFIMYLPSGTPLNDAIVSQLYILVLNVRREEQFRQKRNTSHLVSVSNTSTSMFLRSPVVALTVERPSLSFRTYETLGL